jgi:hypothetical protein
VREYRLAPDGSVMAFPWARHEREIDDEQLRTHRLIVRRVRAHARRKLWKE